MNDCKINAFKAVERGDCRKLKEFLASGEERGVQKMDPKYNATLLHWAALRNQVMMISDTGGVGLPASQIYEGSINSALTLIIQSGGLCGDLH